ncbi:MULTISPECIES: helix-turn-helix transcriptional regulator [unclassified Mesorhizobium]|uniref:helix-turn-helix domain-containing protein n=1 Tax=unclassified Mesorhizobium TaxID=325217 RepID=UPI0024154915|nr:MULTISPECIES: helix-turn-helix transcriptional regulator [unclassified Mesorhizobium]MDG4889993.1 helix-turn-helix transcriptional regulator [Mesorhizobium sp. WSM4887]MDG4904135.1 helix-turn-helix transcriptional regulator [Mesorhizobium sp. WSM4962]MDG4909162.1 helix-turn-helix transcriptional regulator [Mesorhizobium sp. WSM4898]MDG4921786.1 helix-turn-helix transcriptional regulator [Mesorhizobium sp. WSM4989]
MNHDWVYREIGGLIRQRRKKQNLTQEKLAPLVGLSRTSLANIESGRQKLLVHQLFAFASALGLEPPDLLPRPARPVVGQNDMKFSQQLSASQRAQLAQMLADKPIVPAEGETGAKQNKR